MWHFIFKVLLHFYSQPQKKFDRTQPSEVKYTMHKATANGTRILCGVALWSFHLWVTIFPFNWLWCLSTATFYYRRYAAAVSPNSVLSSALYEPKVKQNWSIVYFTIDLLSNFLVKVLFAWMASTWMGRLGRHRKTPSFDWMTKDVSINQTISKFKWMI